MSPKHRICGFLKLRRLQVLDEAAFPEGPAPRLLEKLFLDMEAPEHMIALHQVIV